jgi:hypothetical protein
VRADVRTKKSKKGTTAAGNSIFLIKANTTMYLYPTSNIKHQTSNTKYRAPNNPYQIHQSQFTYQQTHKHTQIQIHIQIIIDCFFEHVHTFRYLSYFITFQNYACQSIPIGHNSRLLKTLRK